ncbi:MAG: hypothetical protein HOJ31_07290 [Anaerolineae bacterium]|nr:hypothetical protein [Anaerolineae bacterium]
MILFKEKLKEWSFPLILAIIALLSFGLFAFQQGFYWDDWAFAWSRAHLGAKGLINLFSVTRPIRGYWEGFLTLLLGTKPAAWQFYAIFTRWLATLALWQLLKTLFPTKKPENILTAFFFLVYPGFTQQPLAVTYQYVWSLLALFFLSLSLVAQAVRNPRHRILKITISVFLSILIPLGVEYFVGLELLRALFIWIALTTTSLDFKERIKKTFLFYIPYLISLIGYLYWRFFLYKETIYSAQEEISFSVLGIWTQLWDALPLVSLGAWLKVFSQPFGFESGLSLRLALVMGAILLAGTFLLASYLKSLVAREAEASTQKYDWDWLFLSVALILAAGIPFYAVNFPVQLTFPEDRFTFPFIFGVSMLLTWLFSLIKNKTQRFTLAALLISLAVTTHIYNGDIYRSEWRLQRLFAQQLFWRAPDIAPGTLILAEDDGIFPHNDDEAFSFLVNWAYNPEQSDTELDYEYFYLSARLGEDLPSLKAGQPIFKDHFAATFEGNTDQTLLLHFSPPSCLRILDPVYDQDMLFAPRGVDDLEMGSLTLPRVLAPALVLSKPRELISKNNDDFNPPTWLFGEEPEHNWCYYFEKADLARQDGDWEKVAKLGDKAFNIPFAPADAAEYLPFIEAYTRLGRYDDAQGLTKIAVEKNPVLRPMFCSLWQRVADDGVLGKSNALLAEIQDALKYCPLR